MWSLQVLSNDLITHDSGYSGRGATQDAAACGSAHVSALADSVRGTTHRVTNTPARQYDCTETSRVVFVGPSADIAARAAASTQQASYADLEAIEASLEEFPKVQFFQVTVWSPLHHLAVYNYLHTIVCFIGADFCRQCCDLGD
jgi:hypothetical protein